MRTAVILFVSVCVLACISLAVADESGGHRVYAFNEDLVAFANGKSGGKYGGGGGYGGGYSSRKAGKSHGGGKRTRRSANPPGGDDQKEGPQGRRRSPK